MLVQPHIGLQIAQDLLLQVPCSVEVERMQTVDKTRGSAMEDTQSNVDDSSDDSMNKH